MSLNKSSLVSLSIVVWANQVLTIEAHQAGKTLATMWASKPRDARVGSTIASSMNSSVVIAETPGLVVTQLWEALSLTRSIE